MLFYSHDGLGLGHLRITLAVARGLARQAPRASGLLLTGSPSVAAFDLPENLEYVRMPGLDKRQLFEMDDDDDDARSLPDVFALRKALIAATCDGFAPDMVVVDHHPAGLAGEFLPVLNRFHAARSRPKLVLGLRDITYGPERTRREWERYDAYALLEQTYDLILVYGSPDVFDPIEEYGLPPSVAAKTLFTGYFRRPEPARPIAEIREELGATDVPLAVVSAGGGADGAKLVEAFLEAIRRGLLPGVVASVVAGPQMQAPEFARLTKIAASLPGVTFVQFRNDLESHVAAADVVITMGGYNSVWEAVGANKRPIVVPRQGGSDEQPLRAARIAALGLGAMLPADELTPASLAHAVTAELERVTTPTPQVTLDFDGVDRAGAALARLLGR